MLPFLLPGKLLLPGNPVASLVGRGLYRHAGQLPGQTLLRVADPDREKEGVAGGEGGGQSVFILVTISNCLPISVHYYVPLSVPPSLSKADPNRGLFTEISSAYKKKKMTLEMNKSPALTIGFHSAVLRFFGLVHW